MRGKEKRGSRKRLSGTALAVVHRVLGSINKREEGVGREGRQALEHQSANGHYGYSRLCLCGQAGEVGTTETGKVPLRKLASVWDEVWRV